MREGRVFDAHSGHCALVLAPAEGLKLVHERAGVGVPRRRIDQRLNTLLVQPVVEEQAHVVIVRVLFRVRVEEVLQLAIVLPSHQLELGVGHCHLLHPVLEALQRYGALVVHVQGLDLGEEFLLIPEVDADQLDVELSRFVQRREQLEPRVPEGAGDADVGGCAAVQREVVRHLQVERDLVAQTHTQLLVERDVLYRLVRQQVDPRHTLGRLYRLHRELGRDAHVSPAPATGRPENLRVLIGRRRLDNLAARQDHAHRDELVAEQAVLTARKPPAPAERQTGHAHGRFLADRDVPRMV